MRKLLKGNQVIATAVSQANVKVLPVYPITPQTTIIETLADFVRDGVIQGAYIPMESEHSVMAACMGAASSGVRTFTATSGQGLLYMHELLHWASGARLPIVMGVVNRAVAPGWNIWMDQSDTLAQRDTGWMHFYTSNHQEVYDHLFMAYKLSEKTLIPSMVIQDAFFLSHTLGEIEIASQETVDGFLPEKPEIPFAFDFKNPATLGSLSDPSNYMEFRYGIEQGFEKAENLIPEIYEEFEAKFGRKYEIYENYRLDDAEVAVILSGTVYETAYKAIDNLRQRGIKAGMLKVRFLRPFFEKELRALLQEKKQIIILDRNYSFGKGGVFADEIRSVLYGMNIPFQPVVAGLGGRDITTKTVETIIENSLKREGNEIYWEGEVYV